MSRTPSPDATQPRRPHGRSRLIRILGAILYWGVVLAVSLALVVGLLLFLESRDAPSLRNAVPENRPTAIWPVTAAISAGFDTFTGNSRWSRRAGRL